MALFGSKKNKNEDKPETSRAKSEKPAKAEKKAVAEKASKRAPKIESHAPSKGISNVLRNPRITEKASLVSEVSNVYVFDVDRRASKRDVAEAIKFFYKEEPLKVNMTMRPSKNVIVRGKRGVKAGGKKAYVYFAKGVNIEVI
jgi:ribosomal protein L23